MRETASAAADIFGCAPDEVFIASTGVIGEVLAHEKIIARLPDATAKLASGGWEVAAEAIRTTDTFAKGASATAEIGGRTVTIAGIAKGSGMIQPNMATMLSFIFTDAAIPASILQEILSPAVDRTFNSITVDSDTSTSDTLLLFATGAATNPAPPPRRIRNLTVSGRLWKQFCGNWLFLVVRDGEGAQKLITVRVTEAASDEARARSRSASPILPLVKTAIAGEDANWGRVVMAVGKSEQLVDASKIKIGFGGVEIAVGGRLNPDYDEAPVSAHLKGQEIRIDVGVGVGQGMATVWTCDLTHGYISINADYRS